MTIVAIRARTQEALIAFFKADLDLAFTFLETARIEVGWDANHCNAAVAKARLVLDTVRRFQGRIANPCDWDLLQHRADQLEAAIDAFGR